MTPKKPQVVFTIEKDLIGNFVWYMKINVGRTVAARSAQGFTKRANLLVSLKAVIKAMKPDDYEIVDTTDPNAGRERLRKQKAV